MITLLRLFLAIILTVICVATFESTSESDQFSLSHINQKSLLESKTQAVGVGNLR